MSLSNLPTELDNRILSYIEQRDVSSMSQASKYYREISENHLYKDIRFNTHEGHPIKRLLVTLLNRADLRRLIQHLTVYNDHQLPWLAAPEVDDYISIGTDIHQAKICTSLMAHAPKVDAFLAGLAAHNYLDPQLKMAMFAKVFEPFPLYDGAFTLILCMATNIECLDMDLYSCDSLAMTRHILRPYMWHPADRIKRDRPVQALTKLVVRCTKPDVGYVGTSHEVKVPSTVETLQLENNVLVVEGWRENFATGKIAAITSLTLKNCNFHPEVLEIVLKEPSLANLEPLVVAGVGRNGTLWHYEDEWYYYDYSRLKQAMLKHLLNLQNFSWTDMYISESVRSIGSFAKFKKLKTLILDVHLFCQQDTDEEGNYKFRNEYLLPEYYPPDLDLLDLRDWSWQEIYSRTRLYEEDPAHDNSGLTMKQMVWTVDLDDSDNKIGCVEVDGNLILQDSVVNTLKAMAQNLASAGVNFSVRYHLGREHGDSSFLVDEGYTATNLVNKYGIEVHDLYVANSGDAKTALAIASGKYRGANGGDEDDESDLSSGDEDTEDSEEHSESSEDDTEDLEEDSEDISEEYGDENSEETSDEEFEYD